LIVVVVRNASERDVDALVSLVNEAFTLEAFFKVGDRTDAAEVVSLMERGAWLVAEENGRIVGAVFVDRHGDRGHYAMLSIDLAEQKKGIGLRLVTAAEDWCRAAGCREVEIEVVNLREELPAFYRRLGYTEQGTRPFPDAESTTRPCHFVVWTKPLK